MFVNSILIIVTTFYSLLSLRGAKPRNDIRFSKFLPFCLLFATLLGCASIGIIQDRLPPPQQTPKGVLFQLNSPSARTVTLAGEFNGWEHRPDQARVIHLKKDLDGIWRTTVNISPGRYQYKYVLDYQTWILDPYNPYTIDDGAGNLNSLLIVK
ncbi:MAG: glycogen-binding domain-containing protein [Elusimicrobiota bacterium]|nr:glycogen-binding domain-containing protein [Elusimicrobiota bacterium]